MGVVSIRNCSDNAPTEVNVLTRVQPLEPTWQISTFSELSSDGSNFVGSPELGAIGVRKWNELTFEVNVSGDETVPESGSALRNELTSCLKLSTTREKPVGDAIAVAATVRQLNKVAANKSCFVFFIIYLDSSFGV